MNIIQKILNRKEFKDQPPVLMDVGASGDIYKEWREIAPHAICIAFDADTRELDYLKKKGNSGYKKVYIYNRIASDKKFGESVFFLTDSPFCSSSLEPDLKKLEVWNFYDKFKINKKVRVKTITPLQALRESNLSYIDWFKADTQGCDLRLFDSLGRNITDKVLAADFEPGIIDSYKGEDKLHLLISYMEKRPFWMSDLDILGSQRISKNIRKEYSSRLSSTAKGVLSIVVKSSPVCGEVSYLNNFEDQASFSKRDFLLMWLFSYLKSQYSFALEVVVIDKERFADPIFLELEKETLNKIEVDARKKYLKKIIKKIVRKFIKI